MEKDPPGSFFFKTSWLAQTARQIRLYVLDRFQANGDPDQPLGNARRGPRLGRLLERYMKIEDALGRLARHHA